MKFKSNAKYGEEPKTGSIFALKYNSLGIVIHKYVGCGGSDMDFAIGAVIDEQPTAFDVDKVISELKRDKFIESECILSDVHQGYNAGLNRAIEIVKSGGAE